MTRLEEVFPPEKRLEFTNYARTAFERAIKLEELGGSSMLLPAFTCGGTFERLFDKYRIEPVFVDVELPSLHMDVSEAQRRIDEANPDVVLLVQMFGLPADMDVWVDICADNDMVLVEDCARALGAQYRGQPVGSFGRYAFYSLRKVSPAMKGGVLATDAPETGSLPPPSDDVTYYGPAVYGARNELPPVFDIRQLDAFNMGLFERYIRDQFDCEVNRNREKALRLRRSLEELGFTFQPDRDGRSYFWLVGTAPSHRDELHEYLRSHDVPVYKIWQEPLGLMREPERFESRYPTSAELVETIIHFPVRSHDKNAVGDVIELVESFYREK